VWLGNKPVEVVVEENGPLAVSAPSGILSVLVANLVRNAFRYTERGSVVVTLGPDQFTVTDTGVGIDPGMQAQMFKGYAVYNPNNSDRVRLGLSIVQRICEHYNWTISVESTKGQGSRFTVKGFGSERGQV